MSVTPTAVTERNDTLGEETDREVLSVLTKVPESATIRSSSPNSSVLVVLIVSDVVVSGRCQVRRATRSPLALPGTTTLSKRNCQSITGMSNVSYIVRMERRIRLK